MRAIHTYTLILCMVVIQAIVPTITFSGGWEKQPYSALQSENRKTALTNPGSVSEKETIKDAGYYWRLAGEPKIGIRYNEYALRADMVKKDRRKVENYIEENLNNNGIEISVGKKTSYLIKVDVSSRLMKNHSDLPAINCGLSYRILFSPYDLLKRGEEHSRIINNGDMSNDDMEYLCMKEIVPYVTRNIIIDLALIMSDLNMQN